ncbi:MAG: Ger(x)C family spore germination protein, partial [Neobacillus sp.]
MSRHRALCLILVISLFFLSGCWDRTELNDLAIELGWGLDQAKNNRVQISAQFIIPSKIGMGQSGRNEAGKTVFIESGTG